MKKLLVRTYGWPLFWKSRIFYGVLVSLLTVLPAVARAVEPEPARSGHQNVQEGTRLIKEEKWHEAKGMLSQAVSADPASAEAHHQLAVVLALLGEYAQAQEEFERARRLEKGPWGPFIDFNIGALTYHRAIVEGRATRSELSRERLERAARDVPGLEGLARDFAYFTQHVGQQSTLLAIDVIGLPPDTSIFVKTVGEDEYAVYQFGTGTVPPLYFYASPTCHALLASQVSDPTVYSQKLDTALDMIGEEPSSRFDRILKWNILLEKSETITDPNRLDEAIQYLESAIRLGLMFPKPHTFLGMVYFHQGRYEEAAASAREALALQPGYERAHQLLKMIEARKPQGSVE